MVWLTGGNQVLIGRFQGMEKVVSQSEFARYYGEGVDRATMVHQTQLEMPAALQQQVKAGTINTQKWDAYLATYRWQVAFAPAFTLDEYAINFVNAERTSAPLTREGLDAYRQHLLTPTVKPVPKACSFYGTAAHGTRYVVRVKAFDEAETQAAFYALHVAAPQSPITLLFTIDKPFAKATLTLQNEAKQIPLLKSPVEVLSED